MSRRQKKEPKRQVRITTEVDVHERCFVNVDVDVDEVLRELDEDDLQAALQQVKAAQISGKPVELVYHQWFWKPPTIDHSRVIIAVKEPHE